MKKKILSLLTAFAMVFGIIAAPFTSAKADENNKLAQTTTKVTVHKLIPADENTTAADIKTQIEALEGDNKYTGQKLDITTNVNKAKEINDVYFVWTNKDRKVIDAEGKVITPEIQLTEDGKLPEGQKTIPTGALAGLTGEKAGVKGKEFDTSKLPTDEYHIYEIHSLSKYVGEKGETLTGTLAVPVVINLPLNDVVEAHVYPKNVQDLPKIDKNFDNEGNGEATGIKNTEFTDTTKDVDIKLGTNESDKDQREKGTAKKQLGDKVPYKVVTEIPKDAKYKKLVWTDQMTEGLKYNKDLAVTLGTETLTLDTHYTVINTDRGFTLRFTEAGLTKVEEAAKTAAQKVTLKYTATITAKAVPGKEDANDVAFDYGNKPGNESEPKEGQPKNGEIKVEKTWAIEGENEITEADKNVKALFTLQVKEGEEWKDVDSYEATAAENFKHTFTGLDNNKTYRVVEQVSGYEPEYVEFKDGVTQIKNSKDKTNPKPLNPKGPKVVTGGKKFVKADQDDGTRLQGAKFKVKNAKNKFLKEKSAKDIQKAINEYKAADKAYKDAVAKATQDQEGKITYPEGVTADSIKELRKTRDEKFAAANIAYEWVEKANATEFESNSKGQIEVYGLAYGEGYKLVETAAPAGYATPTNAEFGFTIDANSYNSTDGVKYAPEEGEADNTTVNNTTGEAMRIKNQKVTIPQTGGIGSLIFIVAGLAIMGGAFVAYKRSQATA